MNVFGNVMPSLLKLRATHYLGVDGDLCKASAFAPEEGVSLVTEQSLPHPPWRNPQQVAVPQSPHTLLLRAVDHTEHLQQ